MDPDAHRLLDYLHGRESRGSKTSVSIALIARELDLPLLAAQALADQLVGEGLIYRDSRGRAHFRITYAGAQRISKRLW